MSDDNERGRRTWETAVSDAADKPWVEWAYAKPVAIAYAAARIAELEARVADLEAELDFRVKDLEAQVHFFRVKSGVLMTAIKDDMRAKSN